MNVTATSRFDSQQESAPPQIRRSVVSSVETSPSRSVRALVIQLVPTGGLVVQPLPSPSETPESASPAQLVEKALKHVQQVAELLPIDPEHERIMDTVMARHLDGRKTQPITRFRKR